MSTQTFTPKIKPKPRPLQPREIKHKIPGEIYLDFEAYGEFFNEAFGEEIPPAELLADILSMFFNGDSQFKQWKAKKAEGANGSGQSTTPETPGASVQQ